MMKNLYIIFILTLYCNLFAELKFENPYISEDLLDDSQYYNFNFKFKNEANYPIRIIKIFSECACTIATTHQSCYMPNECGEIKGTLQIKDGVNVQKVKIILKTDNLKQSTITLNIAIKIKPYITFNPKLLYWKKGEKPNSKQIQIQLEKTVHINVPPKTLDMFRIKENHISNNATACSIEVVPISTDNATREILKIYATKGNKTKEYFIFLIIK